MSSLASGAAWTFVSKGASQALSFAVSVILARFIAPEEFGLVAMVTTVSAFLGLFGDLGFGTAVVQRRELTRAQAEAAFAATAFAGLAMTLLTLALAPAVAAFYGRPVLVPVTAAMGCTFLLAGVGIVPRALLMRDMRISRLAAIDAGSAIAASALGVLLAVLGAGWFALVAATLVTNLVGSILCLLSLREPLPLRTSVRHARPLVKVGAGLLAFSAINYWARTADNLLIGLWFGERQLGIYLRAYTLMLLPITQITGVLGSTMLPALSRRQNDTQGAKRLYLRTVGLVAFVSFPLMLGLWAVARPFTLALFGPQWDDSIPVLRVLAPVGAIQCMLNPTGWIFISQGRTDLMFRWGVLSAVTTIVAIVVGAMLGSPLTVAIAYGVANLLLAVPGLRYAGGLIGLRLSDIFREVRATIVASVAMALVVAAATSATSAWKAPVALGALVTLGATLFVVVSRWLRPPAARDAADLLSRALTKLSPRLANLATWLLVPAEPSRTGVSTGST